MLIQVIPAKRFYEVVKNNGVGLAVVSMGMTSFLDAPADGTNLTAVGEIRLVPDLSTKYTIPWYIFLSSCLIYCKFSFCLSSDIFFFFCVLLLLYCGVS